MADKKKYLILVISLQTVAANLGSMLTPIGNPHNLFLYEYSKMSIQSFLALVTPYWIASIVLVVIMILIFVKKDKVDVDIELKEGEKYDSKNRAKLILYLILFTMAILVVLEVCPLLVALIITVIAALIADRKSILKVDYGLLLTFVFLFIFIGNIKRMDVVITTLDRILEGREFIVSVIASQVICDVPAAILLSAMTSNIDAIIMGTNIGAVGTLIASMASLISFKLYTNVEGGSKRKYLLWFSVVNFSVLIILCIFHYIWMKMPYWIF
jgi:Na+/H+ antiporter NhaD/arsenite permease-like protein